VALVEKLRLRLPPSGSRPAPTAMASSNVDVPLPISPAKNVTGQSRSRHSIEAMAGMLNGYTVRSSS